MVSGSFRADKKALLPFCGIASPPRGLYRAARPAFFDWLPGPSPGSGELESVFRGASPSACQDDSLATWNTAL